MQHIQLLRKYVMQNIAKDLFVAHRATLLVKSYFLPKILGILTTQCEQDHFGQVLS